MMFAGGLRGAVALALVMGMPSSKVDVFAAATLFIIMVTNIILGGATTNVIAYLGVHSQHAGNMTAADTEFTPSEEAAVIRWYELEKRWLPFLRLEIDFGKRERVLQRQKEQAAAMEPAHHDQWRELTLQLVATGGSARASDAKSSLREIEFDDGDGSIADMSNRESKDPDEDPDGSAAEAEARSNAAIDLLMPQDKVSTDNPVANLKV